MTGALDTPIRAVAEALIEQFGGPATYRVITKSFSATTGRSVESATAYSIIMAPPEPYDVSRVDSTTIQVGDVKAMIKAKGIAFTPKPGDQVTFNGTTWQVVRVMPLYSGALPAAYQLHLRQ